ncbi:MAG: hypothetical protein AAFQ24_13040 [Pseudomonadota bacterium]
MMRWFWQKQSNEKAPDLRCGDPSHAQFNKALEERKAPPEIPRDVNAPWMKPETRLRLPPMQPDFEKSLDHEVADKAQKRIEQSKQGKSGRGSSEKTQDEPKPALKPKGDLRRKADQAAREQTYLSALRDEVMNAAQAVPDPGSPAKSQERMPMHAKL